MVKQSKNKKGRLAKSTLSAILAASMVMTSSSFVWAAPDGDVVTEIMVADENVGASKIEDISVEAVGDVSYTYNGEAQKPQFVFKKDGSDEPIKSVFYTVELASDSASDGVNAGTAKYKVTFTEDAPYAFAVAAGSDTFEITIDKADLTPTPATEPIVYTGVAQTPNFTFKNGEKDVPLEKGTEYTVVASKGADLVTSGVDKSVTLALAGDAAKNYELAEDSFTFDIAKAQLTPYVSDKAYTGKEQVPDTVDFHGLQNEEELTTDDYTISKEKEGEDYTNVGPKKVTVALKATDTTKNYDIAEEASIVNYNITEADLTVESKSTTYGYTGEDVYPELEFKTGDETVKLVNEEDYTVTKVTPDLTTPGKKEVKVTLAAGGNYKFTDEDAFNNGTSITVSYSVGKTDLGISAGYLEYNGKVQEPKLYFYNAADEMADSPILVKGRDYTVEADNSAIDAGDYVATVTLTDNAKKFYTLSEEESTVEYSIEPLDISEATIQFKEKQSFVYNGKEQVPSVVSATSYVDGKKTDLTLGKDFVMNYPETGDGEDKGYYTNAGGKVISIKGKGNFTGTIDEAGTYDIEKAAFNKSNVDIAKIKVEFNNTAVEKNDLNEVLTVSGTDIELKRGVDYEVSYLEPGKEKGTYEIIFTGKATDNFKAGGTIKTTYEIVDSLSLADEFAGATVTVNKEAAKKDSTGWYTEYTGEKAGFALALANVPADLKAEVNYTVDVPEAADCVNAGTYNIIITGKKGYQGETVTIPFRVAPKALNTASVSKTVSAKGDITNGVRGGISVNATLGTTRDNERATEVAVIIKDGGKILVNGTDYTYTTDKTAGTICITGLGNYTTAVDSKDTVKTFTAKYALIDQLDLNDSNITATVTGTYAYTGAQIKPDDKAIELKEGSYTLKYGKDYTIDSYSDNTYAGTAKITVKGIGDYTGTRVITFTIIGSALEDAYTFDTIADVTYDGKAHKAEFNSEALPLVMIDKATKKEVSDAVKKGVTVKYYRDGVETKDFTSLGTITVEATAKEGQAYTGKISTTYSIVGQQIGAYADVAAIADQAYTGEAITPEVSVISKDGKTTLVKDTDYTVSYLNNTEIGTATAVIQGIGKYTGQIVATFKITGQMDQTFTVLPAQERDLQKRYMDSKATKVKYTVEPKTEVSYASSNENVVKVDAKTGDITYTGVGKAIITITAAESETYKEAKKELTVIVRPVTPANVKATGGKTIKVTADAVSKEQAPKYQIKVWKTGKKATFINVNNAGNLSKVYTTKSSGKFNVAVRAYKTIDNVHYFSAWSATKTVTVKK